MNTELLTKVCKDACQAGIESERERWVAKLQGLICFDHAAKGCDHSACYTLEDILDAMAPHTCSTCDGTGQTDADHPNGGASCQSCPDCER